MPHTSNNRETFFAAGDWMTPHEVHQSAKRGNEVAAELPPLHGDLFRFPHATKFVARKQGVRTAAEMALECIKRPGDRVPGLYDRANAYALACVKDATLKTEHILW